jgi:hypothetical protein
VALVRKKEMLSFIHFCRNTQDCVRFARGCRFGQGKV